MSTARRTSCPCRNLAEQKTLLLAYSLTPLPLSQPQFVHTHTPSHSRFFFPSLNHSSWQLLHWRSKMIHTRVVFACPATEGNNKLWQESAALCAAFSKRSTKGSRQERTKERMQELMSNLKIFSAKPALQLGSSNWDCCYLQKNFNGEKETQKKTKTHRSVWLGTLHLYIH